MGDPAKARDAVLEQAARSLSLANDRRLPGPVRGEAAEIAAELAAAANQIDRAAG